MSAPSTNHKPQITNQSGQALVIILLVLAVASTIVLSLVSRTITDIAITTKEKEAARAFSAAEAGVEEALIGGALSGTLPGGATYSVTTGSIGTGTSEFVWPQKVGAGDTIPIWFVSHNESGILTCSGLPCFTGAWMRFCWGEEGTSSSDSQTPAIEVSILYLNTPGDSKTARVARAVFDPNAGRRASNQFSSTDGGTCNAVRNFAFGKTISFSDLGIPENVYNTSNGLQTARIRFIYNTSSLQSLGVAGPSTFPNQGTLISSIGKAEEATRKVEVFRSFPDLPPIFDFGVFSGGGLVK